MYLIQCFLYIFIFMLSSHFLFFSYFFLSVCVCAVSDFQFQVMLNMNFKWCYIWISSALLEKCKTQSRRESSRYSYYSFIISILSNLNVSNISQFLSLRCFITIFILVKPSKRIFRRFVLLDEACCFSWISLKKLECWLRSKSHALCLSSNFFFLKQCCLLLGTMQK